IAAQSVQALISFALQVLVARLLGIDDYGRFALLYGVVVLATGVVTGLVGDSLVVLDRADRRIRGALEATLLVVSVPLALVAGTIVWITGFSSPVEALLFSVALVAFVVEEIVRRLLMAEMAFVKVAAIDVAGFIVAAAVLVVLWVMNALSLAG